MEGTNNNNGSFLLRVLYVAAKGGDPSGVRSALQRGADVTVPYPYSDYGETHLHAASRRGHLAIVQVLLDAGVDTEVTDDFGGTPLQDACGNDRFEVVQELVQRGADIYTKNINGRIPLDRATGNPRIVEYLLQRYQEKVFESEGSRSLLTILKQGKPADYLSGNLKLPIGIVTTDQLLSILRYFVEQDPDSIRERNDNGELPLHVACHRLGLLKVIRYLLEQDPATLHIANNDGALPIHLAGRNGASVRSIPVFKYLVEESGGGAGTLCARDKNGYLPLHSLCESGGPQLKAVEFMVKAYPAALSTRTQRGDVPVTLACEAASLEVIFTLVRGDPQVVSP